MFELVLACEPMPPKIKKTKDIKKALKEHDPSFEFTTRGKGSHWSVEHPPTGMAYSLPDQKEQKRCYLKGLIWQFSLPPDIFD